MTKKKLGRPKEIPRPCKVEGCYKPHHCRGYCNMHYKRMLRHNNTNLPEFLPKRTRVEYLCPSCHSNDLKKGIVNNVYTCQNQKCKAIFKMIKYSG